MTHRTLEDGTLLVEERFPLLRGAAVAGAVALAALLVQAVLAHGGRLPGNLVGGFVGATALLAIGALVPDRTVRFEPGAGRVVWRVSRLVGSREGQAPFADVVRVAVMPHSSTTSRDRPTTCYRPMLVTRASAIPLASTDAHDPAEYDPLVRAVYEALGRAYEAPRPASPEELVAAGRIVDAVRAVRERASAAGGRPLGLAEARAVVDAMRNSAHANRRAA